MLFSPNGTSNAKMPKIVPHTEIILRATPQGKFSTVGWPVHIQRVSVLSVDGAKPHGLCIGIVMLICTVRSAWVGRSEIRRNILNGLERLATTGLDVTPWAIRTGLYFLSNSFSFFFCCFSVAFLWVTDVFCGV
jgi:hypothetical protein